MIGPNICGRKSNSSKQTGLMYCIQTNRQLTGFFCLFQPFHSLSYSIKGSQAIDFGKQSTHNVKTTSLNNPQKDNKPMLK